MAVRKILVVDDAATVRMVVRGALSELGHDVVEAVNGKEAIEKLKTDRYHLMITDINMPEMDGIQLTTIVKKISTYKFMPVICLTGENSADFIPKAKAAGACAWIDKPFTPAEVKQTVLKFLR